MDKAYLMSTPMVASSPDVKNDIFQLWDKNEEILGPKVSYLNVISSLIYLTNNIRPNIAFAISLLVKFSSCPT